MSFWGELKRRDVFKVAVAYLLASWLIVQIVGVLTDPLSLPDVLDTVVVVLLAIGFPFALISAWIYEVTPEGLKVTSADGRAAQGSSRSGKRLTYVVTGLLVIALSLMAIDRFLLTPSSREFGTGSRLAVLPCDDLSPDTTNSFFAPGIHEELLNRLAALGTLEVISRTSVQQYANRRPPIPQIAAELGVDAVMECSARYAGDRVLVTVQLIDGESDTHVWSESYPADMSELRTVFDVQAELAMDVANALHVAFLDRDRERVERAPTESRAAYELYLAAQSREAWDEKIERLDRAVELDSAFIDAWVAKSTAHSVLAGIVADAQGQSAAAEAAASRAIELDPRSGSAHAALGLALATQGEWSQAHEEFERARTLGATPREITPRSMLQIAVGDFAGGRATLQAELALDPMSAATAGFLLAAHEMTGQRAARRAGYERGEALFGAWFGDAIEMMLRLGERDTEFLRAWSGATGLGESVIRAAQRHIGASDEGLEALRTLYDDASNPTAADLLLMSAWTAYFGDPSFSLRLARESVARQRLLIWYWWLPLFEDVRRLPEFKSFVRDLGLVDYWREYGWPPFCRTVGENDFECE